MKRIAVCAALTLYGLVSQAATAIGQTAENVAVVINDASPDSKQVGEYYIKARSIPAENVIRIQAPTDDAVQPAVFLSAIQQPIAAALTKASLQDRILYIVLTKDVPLRIIGTGGQDGTVASVDSELTLLYRRLTGRNVPTRGRVDNPYFLGTRPVTEARQFSHREHDIYLVSRIDAFTVEEAKALVDRAGKTAREGQIVLDQRDAQVNRLGEDWLGLAAQNLIKAGHSERVVLEATPKPARDVSPVMGYYSWGSTDPQNRVRVVKMDFVPGAIGASFVSTDARTFKEPPASWMPTNTNDSATWFGGSPQSLVGDLIREGLTGAAGQVSEPYLQSAVRPDVLFPAYLAGFNLVESFYLAMPHLSWQTVVIGDPLCTPFARRPLAKADIEGGMDAELNQPAFFAKRSVAEALAGMPGAPEEAARLLRAGREPVSGRRSGRRAPKRSSRPPSWRRMQLRSISSWRSCYAASGRAGAGRGALPQGDCAPAGATSQRSTTWPTTWPCVRRSRRRRCRWRGRRCRWHHDNATIMDTVGWIEFLLGNNAEAARLLVLAAKGRPEQCRRCACTTPWSWRRRAPGPPRCRAGRGHQARSQSREASRRRKSCGRGCPLQN